MTDKRGLVVERIGMVGVTDSGEHLGVEMQFDDGQVATVLVPYGLSQKLMLGIMAAGALAHRDQVQRLGSEENVLGQAGYSPFRPTGFQLGRARAPEGGNVVLMRLKQGELPVIDTMIGFAEAERLGRELLAEVIKGPAKPHAPN